MKKLIVFDLDGTLADSKSAVDPEMSGLLHDLLGIVKVAVISGGGWPQFEKQFVSNLPHDKLLANLSLLPTCGTKFYRYESADWKKIYSEDFTTDQREKILDSLKKAIGVADFSRATRWQAEGVLNPAAARGSYGQAWFPRGWSRGTHSRIGIAGERGLMKPETQSASSGLASHWSPKQITSGRSTAAAVARMRVSRLRTTPVLRNDLHGAFRQKGRRIALALSYDPLHWWCWDSATFSPCLRHRVRRRG